jgi:hypothetical protein
MGTLASRKPMKTNPIKYFVVRHDLGSLGALPNYVWRTGLRKYEIPHRFRSIAKGSKWVSYAFEGDGHSSDRLRYVTGIYSCTKPCHYGPIPLSASKRREWAVNASAAWLIKGSPVGEKLRHPVLVPTINHFFDSKGYDAVAIRPITKQEFDRICKYVFSHQLPPDEIPVLKREPESEQEVLAIFLQAYQTLGVKRIVRVQQGFPDIEVELAGRKTPVRIELELYSQSYIAHGHPRDKNIAVLCWLNDDPRGKGKKVKGRVHKVFELRELLRRKERIVW